MEKNKNQYHGQGTGVQRGSHSTKNIVSTVILMAASAFPAILMLLQTAW
jgi:hypothetical protein